MIRGRARVNKISVAKGVKGRGLSHIRERGVNKRKGKECEK